MKKIIRAAFTKRDPVDVPLSGEPSRTKQEFKKEVNINEIIARMRRGISPPPWMTSATPRYGDFSNLPASFQESYAIVEAGERAFASLPLEFRRALDHDPRNLDRAPRSLYEQFGLLKQKSGEASPPTDREDGSPASPVAPKEQNLPANSRSGSKKAAQNAAQNADD
ncbi:MAG: internal scaffolding protein [Arizlama microvirus]|nr:MAG: internal scaffolding protein [Arizlama microvirus]